MLTKEQQKGFMEVIKFINNPNEQFMSISGGAGTGKTYFISQIADGVLKHADKDCGLKHIAITATTNKATAVIAEAMPQCMHGISTIYSFMNLRLRENFKDGTTTVIPTNKWQVHNDTLIIVDECSMVDTKLYKYLTMGISSTSKILFIGDKNQLSPVMEPISPIYKNTMRTFEFTKPIRNADQPALMELCEQAKQTVLTGIFTPIVPVPGVIDFVSGDQLKGVLERGYHSEDPTKRVISYTNNRVTQYNGFIRGLRGYLNPIVEGEILSNNENCQLNKATRLFTDQLVEVVSVDETYNEIVTSGVQEFSLIDVTLKALNLPETYKVTVFANITDRQALLKHLAQRKHWDSYFMVKNNYPDLRPIAASTAHKAQGSTYEDVIVDLGDIGKCTLLDQTARLQYVALSRPKSRLYIRGQLPERYFK